MAQDCHMSHNTVLSHTPCAVSFKTKSLIIVLHTVPRGHLTAVSRDKKSSTWPKFGIILENHVRHWHDIFALSSSLLQNEQLLLSLEETSTLRVANLTWPYSVTRKLLSSVLRTTRQTWQRTTKTEQQPTLNRFESLSKVLNHDKIRLEKRWQFGCLRVLLEFSSSWRLFQSRQQFAQGRSLEMVMPENVFWRHFG